MFHVFTLPTPPVHEGHGHYVDVTVRAPFDATSGETMALIEEPRRVLQPLLAGDDSKGITFEHRVNCVWVRPDPWPESQRESLESLPVC